MNWKFWKKSTPPAETPVFRTAKAILEKHPIEGWEMRRWLSLYLVFERKDYPWRFKVGQTAGQRKILPYADFSLGEDSLQDYMLRSEKQELNDILAKEVYRRQAEGMRLIEERVVSKFNNAEI